MIDPEMQALLSGHAAGTLTPEEKRRLHEAALKNQTIFDAMAEEEPLRAALMSSVAKQGLLRALQKIEDTRRPVEIPKSNNWLWAAIAACLVISVATVSYWPTAKPVTQEVAVATKPTLMPEAAPAPEPKRAPRTRANAPPPTPAQAPVAVAESTKEKREAEVFKQPQAPAVAVADSARQEVSAAPSNSFRERNVSSVAKLAKTNPQPTAEIFNDNLVVSANEISQIYGFLVDGESIKPLTTANEKRRSIPIGTHSTKAEVWILITATEDPVLARALSGVLPLPTRNWIKLKTNP